MSLRRGDIVFVAVKGSHTAKPRPVVVVRATDTLDLLESVTVCPLTSVDLGAHFMRMAVATGPRSGLDRDSQNMADKVVTVPRSAFKILAARRMGCRVRQSTRPRRSRKFLG